MEKLRPRGARGVLAILAVRRAEAAEEALHRRAGRERRVAASKLIVRAPPSTLTRTEITEGFTFSTMSAKPTGRCAVCA